jgi:feruloyl esterase
MQAIKKMVDRVLSGSTATPTPGPTPTGGGTPTPTPAPTATPTPAPVCYTAANYYHVQAGRAHDSGGYALANGSNQNMGLDNVFYQTTLKKTGTNYYVIGTCP